jgi:transposase-like protein
MARTGRRSSKDERIDAIRLLEQGYTKVQVARILNVTESSVYGWQRHTAKADWQRNRQR